MTLKKTELPSTTAILLPPSFFHLSVSIFQPYHQAKPPSYVSNTIGSVRRWWFMESGFVTYLQVVLSGERSHQFRWGRLKGYRIIKEMKAYRNWTLWNLYILSEDIENNSSSSLRPQDLEMWTRCLVLSNVGSINHLGATGCFTIHI